MGNEDRLGVAVTNLMSRQMIFSPESTCKITALRVLYFEENELGVKCICQVELTSDTEMNYHEQSTHLIQFIGAGVWPHTFHNRFCISCIQSEPLAWEVNIKKAGLFWGLLVQILRLPREI